MRKIALVLSLLMTCNKASAAALPSSKDGELGEIVERALLLRDPTVIKLWGQSQNFYAANKVELNAIKGAIAAQAGKAEYDKTKASVLKSLAKAEERLASFATQLTARKPGENISWQLKTHKMATAVTKAKALVEASFEELFAGKLPIGYGIDAKGDPVVLEDLDTIYGDSKGIALKTALVHLLMALTSKTNMAELPEVLKNPMWLDTSAFVHLTAIPTDMDVTALASTPYLYTDSVTHENYLTVIHNGYTFGGHRGEPRYADGKIFGPEDCSSGMAKLVGIPHTIQVSTWDFLYTHRWGRGMAARVLEADYAWATNPIGASMLGVLAPVVSDAAVALTPDHIQPGQIYAHRNFKPEDEKRLFGVGGHTNLVLGLRPSTKNTTPTMITLGWSRGYPELPLDGFAIQEYAFDPTDPLREVMLFNLKENAKAAVCASLK